MPRSSENIQSESQYISNCQLKRDCQLHWYAVRVTYSRELSLKDYLDKADIENFIQTYAQETGNDLKYTDQLAIIDRKSVV